MSLQELLSAADHGILADRVGKPYGVSKPRGLKSCPRRARRIRVDFIHLFRNVRSVSHPSRFVVLYRRGHDPLTTRRPCWHSPDSVHTFPADPLATCGSDPQELPSLRSHRHRLFCSGVDCLLLLHNITQT